jgi:uncharacterized protein YkwD
LRSKGSPLTKPPMLFWLPATTAVLVAALVALATIIPSASARAQQLRHGFASERSRGCQGADRLPARTSARELRGAVRCLVNGRRRAHGLRPLWPSRALGRAATRHSFSMVRHDFFSHFGTNGSSVLTRVRRAGYMSGANVWSVGEVIAYGLGRSGTPRAIVRAWMHSPSHRAQIVSPAYRHLGVGAVHGAPAAGRRGATYTIDFGARGG